MTAVSPGQLESGQIPPDKYFAWRRVRLQIVPETCVPVGMTGTCDGMPASAELGHLLLRQAKVIAAPFGVHRSSGMAIKLLQEPVCQPTRVSRFHNQAFRQLSEMAKSRP